jgi:hypothetical protein
VTKFNPMAEFDRLLSEFAPSLATARELESLNPEDDEFVKLAVVGFSLHEEMELWRREHYEFIKARLEGDISPDNLDWYEEAAPSVAAFSCLALGALQGLYNRRNINDAEVLHGEMILPGFTMLHNEQIARLYAARAQ